MLYLIVQISEMLGVAAVVFFAFGVVFARQFLRRKPKFAEFEDSSPDLRVGEEGAAEAHHAVVDALNQKLAEQGKRIETLLQAQAELQAELEMQSKVSAPGVTEHVVTEPIKLMESALEAQGQLLDAKTREFDALRAELDVEHDRNQFLTNRNFVLEEELKNSRAAVGSAPAIPPEAIEERDRTIQGLIEMSESLEQSLQEVQKELGVTKLQLEEKQFLLDSALQTVAETKARAAEPAPAPEEKTETRDFFDPDFAAYEQDINAREPAVLAEGMPAPAETVVTADVAADDELPPLEPFTDLDAGTTEVSAAEFAPELPAPPSPDPALVERIERLESELQQREEIWLRREDEMKAQYIETLEGRDASIRILETELHEVRSESNWRGDEIANLQTTLDHTKNEIAAQVDTWQEREQSLERRHEQELQNLQRELAEIKAALEHELHHPHVALEAEPTALPIEMPSLFEPTEFAAPPSVTVATPDPESLRRLWDKLDHMDIELHAIDDRLRTIQVSGQASGTSREDAAEVERLRRFARDLQLVLSEREQRIRELEFELAQVRRPSATPAPARHVEIQDNDDLSLVRGIGPQTKSLLEKEFGIRTFRQLAELQPKLIEQISKRLRFQGRIERDDWMGQARELHRAKYGDEKKTGVGSNAPDAGIYFSKPG